MWKMTTLSSAFNTPQNSYDGERITISARIMAEDRALRRALQPPGYHKEWHVAVRVASNKKLVAFISAIPVKVRVRDK